MSHWESFKGVKGSLLCNWCVARIGDCTLRVLESKRMESPGNLLFLPFFRFCSIWAQQKRRRAGGTTHSRVCVTPVRVERLHTFRTLRHGCACPNTGASRTVSVCTGLISGKARRCLCQVESYPEISLDVPGELLLRVRRYSSMLSGMRPETLVGRQPPSRPILNSFVLRRPQLCRCTHERQAAEAVSSRQISTNLCHV